MSKIRESISGSGLPYVNPAYAETLSALDRVGSIEPAAMLEIASALSGLVVCGYGLSVRRRGGNSSGFSCAFRGKELEDGPAAVILTPNLGQRHLLPQNSSSEKGALPSIAEMAIKLTRQGSKPNHRSATTQGAGSFSAEQKSALSVVKMSVVREVIAGVAGAEQENVLFGTSQNVGLTREASLAEGVTNLECFSDERISFADSRTIISAVSGALATRVCELYNLPSRQSN